MGMLNNSDEEQLCCPVMGYRVVTIGVSRNDSEEGLLFWFSTTKVLLASTAYEAVSVPERVEIQEREGGHSTAWHGAKRCL